MKRKGLGGLSPEKKKLLKQLIMQKAAEDLKKQQQKEAQEKQRVIEERVPKLDLTGLNQSDLTLKVRDLYDTLVKLEDEKYDWETKLRKQNFEINELNIKVNDIKGHFVKPMLKKVSKTEQQLAKFDKEKLRCKFGFREGLKSTGQPKYFIDEKEDTTKKPDWVQLKHKDSEVIEDKKEDEKASEAASTSAKPKEIRKEEKKVEKKEEAEKENEEEEEEEDEEEEEEDEDEEEEDEEEEEEEDEDEEEE